MLVVSLGRGRKLGSAPFVFGEVVGAIWPMTLLQVEDKTIQLLYKNWEPFAFALCLAPTDKFQSLKWVVVGVALSVWADRSPKCSLRPNFN